MGEERPFQIIALPVARWREHREIRLQALLSDPLAFGSTYEESIAFPDDIWRRRLGQEDSILRFAERDGRLIGMAGVLLGVHQTPDLSQIIAVFVAREHRRQGVARALLAALLDELRTRPEIGRIRLNVTESQTGAIALYEALGFVQTGREADLHYDGDRVYEELVMERPNR